MDNDFRHRYRRDFSSEIIRPPQSAAPARLPRKPIQAAHPVTHAQPARRRRLFIISLLLVLVAAAAGGGYWYRSHKLASPIPVSIRASVNFPLLYPARLPAGYHLDSSSFNTSGGVVLYSAVGGAVKIAFTVQQRPSTFDFNNFYKQGLSNSTLFDTPAGQAAIGTANGRPLGSLVTDQSWMLVSSSSSSISSTDLRLILENTKISDR